MSYRAIAAALALEDVSLGERLVAFSLASFANRAHHAWPGVRAAALRAGLSRSQYLAASARLESHGLIERNRTGGAGRSTAVDLCFVDAVVAAEYEINPGLFEQVLSHSATRGATRVLLGVLAAVADGDGRVNGLTVQELRDAAGASDSSYRRARAALLASGAVILRETGGGRGRSNYWQVVTPASLAPRPPRARHDQPALDDVCRRPQVAVARDPSDSRSGGGVEAANPATNPVSSRARGTRIPEPGNQTP